VNHLKVVIIKIKYVASLITVKDIDESRKFYEEIMNQEVELDHRANVSFKAGFAIHDVQHYQELLGETSPIQTDFEKHFMELYFECEDLEEIERTLESLNCKFLHKIREQPWGQRVMRFFDPDGYIVEVARPLEFVVRRFAAQGLSVEQISESSSMPIEFVKMVLGQIQK